MLGHSPTRCWWEGADARAAGQGLLRSASRLATVNRANLKYIYHPARPQLISKSTSRKNLDHYFDHQLVLPNFYLHNGALNRRLVNTSRPRKKHLTIKQYPLRHTPHSRYFAATMVSIFYRSSNYLCLQNSHRPLTILHPHPLHDNNYLPPPRVLKARCGRTAYAPRLGNRCVDFQQHDEWAKCADVVVGHFTDARILSVPTHSIRILYHRHRFDISPLGIGVVCARECGGDLL